MIYSGVDLLGESVAAESSSRRNVRVCASTFVLVFCASEWQETCVLQGVCACLSRNVFRTFARVNCRRPVLSEVCACLCLCFRVLRGHALKTCLLGGVCMSVTAISSSSRMSGIRLDS